MNKTKEVFIVISIFLVFLSISFVSAGFFDLFKKDPSLAPSQQTDVSVNVGNAAPTIVSVTPIPAVNLLAGTTTDVTVTFTAEDSNGAADLNDATASASFTFGGEPVRSNAISCGAAPGGLNQRVYTCTITMQYFDENAIWTVTVNVDDQSASTATDSSTTVTINLLRDMSISPTIINFPATTQSATNIQSNDIPSNTQITNQGNFDTPSDGSIQITGADLTGTLIPAEVIPVADIRAADLADVLTVCSTGSALIDTIAVGITGANLPRGIAGSNTGDLTYCITLVPPAISSQGYTAEIGTNPWTIGI